jgi:hypothetical protein
MVIGYGWPFGAFSMSSALVGAMLMFFIIAVLAIYLYTAWAMYTIGKKLKIEPYWLAWVPAINVFYIPILAGYEWYYGFLWLLAMIPFIGWLVAIGLIIWWWWRISEARKREGWFGILMAIPVVNLVIVGLLAWEKK